MTDGGLTPLALLSKAKVACASAEVLIALGDVDGASNRAYYAMFDAAKAALLERGPIDSEIGRTHSGLISAFGQNLVKTGLLSKELGRVLNRAHEVRLIADYTDQSVQIDDARQIVERAKAFVGAIETAFFSQR